MIMIVVVTTKTVIMVIGFSETKMTTISVRCHFVPGVVTTHLKTDKCLLLHMIFAAALSNRYMTYVLYQRQ
jgi:hypothetical protein